MYRAMSIPCKVMRNPEAGGGGRGESQKKVLKGISFSGEFLLNVILLIYSVVVISK